MSKWVGRCIKLKSWMRCYLERKGDRSLTTASTGTEWLVEEMEDGNDDVAHRKRQLVGHRGAERHSDHATVLEGRLLAQARGGGVTHWHTGKGNVWRVVPVSVGRPQVNFKLIPLLSNEGGVDGTVTREVVVKSGVRTTGMSSRDVTEFHAKFAAKINVNLMSARANFDSCIINTFQSTLEETHEEREEKTLTPSA
mmetsp:Transcript_114750/g.331616  ORF Transcript_114750/g.331616 Transcript_114750/m.331616 type:complete len:196 (+) Transcript_114750:49-636(+)